MKPILLSSEILAWESEIVKTLEIGATQFFTHKDINFDSDSDLIKRVLVQRSLHNLRVAIEFKTGHYGFRFISIGDYLNTQYFSNLRLVHNFFERPSNRAGGELLEMLGWIDPRKAFDQVWEQVNEKREFFKIPDHGKSSTPFNQLHYWNWLSKNESERKHHKIKTRQRYLNEIGFSIYKHKLCSDDVKILGITLDYHWQAFHYPKHKVVT